LNNIRVVDDIVRETELLMSGFYGDKETSYIFTADHGMSKRGNHGDGGIWLPSRLHPCVINPLFRS
jgi:phosphatidylinositol glycan class N